MNARARREAIRDPSVKAGILAAGVRGYVAPTRPFAKRNVNSFCGYCDAVAKTNKAVARSRSAAVESGSPHQRRDDHRNRVLRRLPERGERPEDLLEFVKQRRPQRLDCCRRSDHNSSQRASSGLQRFASLAWGSRGVRKSVSHAARAYSLMRPPRRSRRWMWPGRLASARWRRGVGAGGLRPRARCGL